MQKAVKQMSKRAYVELIEAIGQLENTLDPVTAAHLKQVTIGHKLVDALEADSSDYLDTYAEYLEACEALDKANNPQ